MGLPALALTDHDSLAGAVRFYHAARQAGVHPILGAEVTLEGEQHLTLLCENQEGYASLCRLISASRLEQLPQAGEDAPWPGKVDPVVDVGTPGTYSRGLLALSGCRRGPVAQPLLQEKPEAAQAALQRLLDIYGARASMGGAATPRPAGR